MKDFLLALDKPPVDLVSERLDKEPITKKYWFNFMMAILLPILTCFLAGFILMKRSQPIPATTMAVTKDHQRGYEVITLPFPHQSFQNVSAWIFEAIMASYSFDFNNYSKQVERAAYYFTPDGYSTYLTALTSSKIEKDILDKRLSVSIVPLKAPVMINSGEFGNTVFYRFRVPVLVSYYGGKTPVVQQQMVEMVVLRLPSYQSAKSLAISEFNMVPL